MRYEIFAAGIILLVIGFLFYLPAHDAVEKYDSYGIFSDIGKVISDDMKNDYQHAKNMENVGIIIIAVSIAIIAAGIVTKKNESSKK
jgi:hypothetical protein